MSRKARIWISLCIFAGVAALTLLAEGTRSSWEALRRWVLLGGESGVGEAIVGAASIKPFGGHGPVDAAGIPYVIELKYAYTVNFKPYARIEQSPVYESMEAAQAAINGLSAGSKIKVQISYKDPKLAVYFVDGLKRSAVTSVILLGAILGGSAGLLGVWIWRGGRAGGGAVGGGEGP